MKVTAYIRKKTAAKNNVTDQVTVYFRVRAEGCDIKAASELAINPNHWSPERQGYKSRVALVSDEKRRSFDRQVREIAELIAVSYHIGADGEWLKRLITQYHHPGIYRNNGEAADTRLAYRFKDYAEKRQLVRKSLYKVNSIVGKISRFERYQREVLHKRAYSMRVDSITEEDLYAFKKFCMEEYLLAPKHPSIYKDIPRWRIPKEPLSENGMYDILHHINTVMKWCERNGIPTQKPFLRFEMHAPVYGTPWFLTLEERDRIYYLDLTGKPNQLQYHRDIFMFQCLVGCRMGDIPRMTRDNIVGGALEYIPHKTKEGNPRTVRVPLNGKAKAILERYKDRTGTLLPYFEDWHYNNSIRELCTLAGITRMVSVIDVKTREEVKRPLNEIASSHMARRTFIGNLYKQVKDPDLIASMSGHVDGSRAFNRYRAIDDEMKIELVNMIN